MDQFTYAERATDWRGNNNIAESIFEQMSQEPYPEPMWVVCGAGTGGTSAMLSRYLRYIKLDTQLCVVDPENSTQGERYLNSYYDRRWLQERGHHLEPYPDHLEHVYCRGEWSNDLVPNTSVSG